MNFCSSPLITVKKKAGFFQYLILRKKAWLGFRNCFIKISISIFWNLSEGRLSNFAKRFIKHCGYLKMALSFINNFLQNLKPSFTQSKKT
jgi:hypothetical protein